jgi:hypothetical protein
MQAAANSRATKDCKPFFGEQSLKLYRLREAELHP